MSFKVSVITFAGTNCDFDTKWAFEKLGCEVTSVWHKDESLPESDLVVLPGGFSYGDYLRSGAIAKFSPVMKAIKEYANKGGRVLGICNGFQILVESGLLPGALKRNENLHFISKHHHLKVVDNNNIFLSKMKKDEVVNIPIAHADGNYYNDQESIKKMYENGQVLLHYCDENGQILNPNGSVDSIAGICNETKNVFGLMPHPERAMQELLLSKDGVRMLEGIIS
jgi:phosphoribosylformylglycinamidine synthase